MNVIINDAGGLLSEHIVLGQHYAAIGANLIVVYCTSACLILLAQVPQNKICFRPGAWVGYHSSAWQGGSESTTTMKWERGRDWIARGYAKCE